VNGTTTNFKIQLNLIAILRTFRGRANEEPYTHLCVFFSIADTHEVQEACSMCEDPSHLADRCQLWGSPSPFEEQVNGAYGSRQEMTYFLRVITQGDNHLSNLDQKFDKLLDSIYNYNQVVNQRFEATNQRFKTTKKSITTLERQVGQLAYQLSKRDHGKLPTYTNLNPAHKKNGNEHVNMVTSLHSGETYNNKVKVLSMSEFTQDDENFVFENENVVGIDKDEKDKPEHIVDGVKSTTIPYPSALEKLTSSPFGKRGPNSEDMWETFKQVKINLPLIDAIKQILAYAKFLKDLCTQKRKLKASLPKKIDLTEHVSAILSSPFPLKFKDPGAPLISIMMGNITIKKALLDLADRSTKIPRGILEDVIVKVDDFYYLVDIIDEEVQKHVPRMLKDNPFDLYFSGENEEVFGVEEVK
ncbi:hypothetical protein Tco_0921594, partial [Tanacetum coccineum]